MVLLITRFLDVVKFTTVTPLSILISYGLSFQIIGLKISFIPTLRRTYGTDQIHVLVPHRSCPLHHGSYPHMGRAHLKQ
jgi:hypothetical protein